RRAPVGVVLGRLRADERVLPEVVRRAVAVRQLAVLDEALKRLRVVVGGGERRRLEARRRVERAAVGEVEHYRLEIDGREVGDARRGDVDLLEELVVEVHLFDEVAFVELGDQRREQAVGRVRARLGRLHVVVERHRAQLVFLLLLELEADVDARAAAARALVDVGAVGVLHALHRARRLLRRRGRRGGDLRLEEVFEDVLFDEVHRLLLHVVDGVALLLADDADLDRARRPQVLHRVVDVDVDADLRAAAAVVGRVGGGGRGGAGGAARRLIHRRRRRHGQRRLRRYDGDRGRDRAARRAVHVHA